MKNRIHLFAILILIAVFLYLSYQVFVGVGRLQIIFLNVGQGDSILIQKGTKQILIDGGPNGKTELAELGKHIPYFDREIEAVIVTHPDRDHIGGLSDVARNYKIGKVVETKAEKDTAAFGEWREIIAYDGVETVEAVRGDEINFGGVKIRILFPFGSVGAAAGDANNSSVVARLDYGGNSFLFTGDLETAGEGQILKSGENINVDVLKIGHHGSKSSSSEEFLDAASPEEAVISVGVKNSYGHPHAETLSKLETRNIKVHRTDEDSDIIYECKNPESKCARAQDLTKVKFWAKLWGK
ncbi:MAG: ComEC/Rec2 family competence protein [Candidatus Moranbacteria bacterium]|nr:ComEC/Rec2 family competence protein [Candidatus Moranbacteria bacterium]